MTRARALALALAGVLAAAVIVVARPSLPQSGASPDACVAGAPGPQFCPTLPSFEPPARASPSVRADQLAPCSDSGSFRPSFCVALPSASGRPDRAMLIARRRDACAQLTTTEAPVFCLAPPGGADDAALARQAALVLLRQRLGTAVRRVGDGTLDLWAETAVPDAAAATVDSILRADRGAVEAYFATRFRDVPAVFLFASQRSFRAALERQFGYAAGAAGLLADQYGGILVAGIDVIAINGENVAAGPRPTIFRHELTHVMAHQLAGATLPFWFDEGLATLVATPDPAAFDIGRATALSILHQPRLAPVVFDESRSWVDRNAALSGNAYGVAAESVRLVVDRLGRSGLTALLEDVAARGSFAIAFAAAFGEPLSAFVAEAPGRVTAACPRGVGLEATRPDGLVLWWLEGFGPSASVAITVDGPARYAFTVTTDALGVYTGTLGPPMPSGRYVLRAQLDAAAVTIPLVIGAAQDGARSCAG